MELLENFDINLERPMTDFLKNYKPEEDDFYF